MFSFRVCWFCIIWKQSFNKINWDTPEVDKTKPPCLWENVPKNTHLVKHPKTSWCYKQPPNTKTKTNKYQIFSLESAGSVSVAFHLLSPLSRDLFTRQNQSSSSPSSPTSPSSPSSQSSMSECHHYRNIKIYLSLYAPPNNLMRLTSHVQTAFL